MAGETVPLRSDHVMLLTELALKPLDLPLRKNRPNPFHPHSVLLMLLMLMLLLLLLVVVVVVEEVLLLLLVVVHVVVVVEGAEGACPRHELALLVFGGMVQEGGGLGRSVAGVEGHGTRQHRRRVVRCRRKHTGEFSLFEQGLFFICWRVWL